jgi:hypothetical protein
MVAYAVEDILNMALRRVGNRVPIGYIYEGSRASRVGLEIYGQTRDSLLRDGEWDFSRRTTALTLLKTAPAGGYGVLTWAPTYPQPPWTYEYSYPVDCLKVRSIRTAPIFLPVYDPRPNVFSIGNDNQENPNLKVILTDAPNALATYSAQVTAPTLWEPAFMEALIEALGRRFAEAAALDPALVKEREEMAERAGQMAAGIQG